MDFTEKTISSESIYRGKIINLKVDTVELPDGNTALRELVEHPGGVAVVAVDDSNNVYLVEQFRKPYNTTLIEIPAGKLEKGEDPLVCGKRELEEETGLIAGNMMYLGECYPTVGYTNEVIRIFLATELNKTSQNLDADEFLNVKTYHIDDIMEMIMNNQIKDSKTIVGIMKAYIKLGFANK